MTRTATLLFLAGPAIAPMALFAQRSGCTEQQARILHEHLVDEPGKEAHIGAARYTLVNARFETVTDRRTARKEVTYIRRVVHAKQGWSVQVITADNRLLMDGTSLDRDGLVLDGDFTYRDERGQLRAEGRFDHGRKTGVWHRYDAHGEAIPDKTYHAEDWDGLQVRVGLASMSNDLGDASAQGAQAAAE